jgi:hypothetical protein
MNLELKHAYLRDTYSKTYDELLVRITQRDNWIKIQLICQLALVAISAGLKLQIINSDSPVPNALSFCLPISFVIFLQFQIEETIIALLSRYIGEMSEAEEVLNPGFFVHNFDSSVAVGDFWRKSQNFRTTSIIIVFLMIPLSLWLYRIRTLKMDTYFMVEVTLSSILILFISYNIYRGWKARRSNAKAVSNWIAHVKQ